MASTYSTNLLIELIGTGEQSGTWGVTTDDNFSYVFEQALVGRSNVVFSNADVTINTSTTISSVQPFRSVYLNCTGTNTASKNLIVPTINKNYIIENNTTGGFPIVVKTTLGTGITVPSGKKVPVYVNGTDVVSAFDYIGNSLGVSGNLAVGGNVSGVDGVFSGNVSGAVATFTADSAFNGTGALKIPVGTTVQQPTPATGMLRFNTTNGQFEGYDGTKWTSVGGAQAAGAVYENKNSITSNYTMTTDYNGESVGPINIAAGVTITIPAGSRWVVL